MDVRVDGCTDGWMHGRTDGWMDGRTGVWMGWTAYGLLLLRHVRHLELLRHLEADTLERCTVAQHR